MRHTRAHTANRRSHHALKAANLVACKDCGAMKSPHTVCDACGMYRGKKVLKTKAKKAVSSAKTSTK
jgi:large subunit ribosomal protein L32